MQGEWYSFWMLCQTQRYGQGMVAGTIIHSEIWTNLQQYGYEGHLKERLFRIIMGVDMIYLEYVREEEKRRSSGGNPVEGVKKVIAGQKGN